MAGMIVHHEVLQASLQHHAILVKLHMRSVLDRAANVAMLDLPLASDFDRRAAVGAANRRAAEARHRRFDRDLRRRFRLAHRLQNRFGAARWSAIRPFTQPCDSASPQPIRRSPSGSSTPTANRVRLLPASSQPRNVVSRPSLVTRRDAVIEP